VPGPSRHAPNSPPPASPSPSPPSPHAPASGAPPSTATPALRALVDSRRHDTASAGTLTGLADDITALRTAIEAIAARVRRHEEQIRQLNRKEK
jgi:hypothetical protein